jgi:hypothetical protein
VVAPFNRDILIAASRWHSYVISEGPAELLPPNNIELHTAGLGNFHFVWKDYVELAQSGFMTKL